MQRGEKQIKRLLGDEMFMLLKQYLALFPFKDAESLAACKVIHFF